MHMASHDKDCNQWVLLIPIYHMSFGTNLGTRGTDDKTPQWWGTPDFDSSVQRLKAVSKSRYV